jgi:tetratricopeptide (TPR) repeat protein
MMKGWTYELAGKPDAAFAAYREGLVAAGASKESLQRMDAVYRADGLPGYYKLWLSRSSPGNRPLSDTWLAQIYVRTGELDRALTALEQAFQKRESALAWVNVDPGFRLLHADARFQRIAGKIGHN